MHETYYLLPACDTCYAAVQPYTIYFRNFTVTFIWINLVNVCAGAGASVLVVHYRQGALASTTIILFKEMIFHWVTFVESVAT